jgi:hypothetical protein
LAPRTLSPEIDQAAVTPLDSALHPATLQASPSPWQRYKPHTLPFSRPSTVRVPPPSKSRPLCHDNHTKPPPLPTIVCATSLCARPPGFFHSKATPSSLVTRSLPPHGDPCATSLCARPPGFFHSKAAPSSSPFPRSLPPHGDLVYATHCVSIRTTHATPNTPPVYIFATRRLVSRALFATRHAHC